MALLRNKELKTMSKDELSNKLHDLRKELMKLNAQIATGTTPKSPGHVRTIKKTIAKILNTKFMEEPKKNE